VRYAGLDIGSRSIELVVWEDNEVALYRRGESGFDPLRRSEELMRGVAWDRLVVTGYGRGLYARRHGVETLTEIQAHALGARRLFPSCGGVLDIGGQDTKAIALDRQGRVRKFEMNDRCAAGTGKFLEFMAGGMGVSLAEFGEFALAGREGITISSMCTVFAESEATSLVARGHRPQDIALALHRAVLKRALAMLRRVGVEGPVVFTGGVARNPCLCRLLGQELNQPLLLPPEPEMVGALGAALHAARYSAGSDQPLAGEGQAALPVLDQGQVQAQT